MGRRYSKTEGIVVGGISTAIVILSLYGGTIVRTNRIAFLVLASFVSSLPYIRGGIGTGVITYIASSALAMILIPNKLYGGVFIFFGIYPLIKLLSERNKTILEFLIKYVWFNLTLGISYLIYKNFIFLNKFFYSIQGVIILVVALEAAFLVYDFIFTKFIMYIQDRLFKSGNSH